MMLRTRVSRSSQVPMTATGHSVSGRTPGGGGGATMFHQASWGGSSTEAQVYGGTGMRLKDWAAGAQDEDRPRPKAPGGERGGEGVCWGGWGMTTTLTVQMQGGGRCTEGHTGGTQRGQRTMPGQAGMQDSARWTLRRASMRLGSGLTGHRL